MTRALRGVVPVAGGTAAALFALGPYEPVETDARFGDGVLVCLKSVEARYDDTHPDSAKRVIWAQGQNKQRSFAPINEDQAAHCTTDYPSAAVFPSAALVRHAAAQDYSRQSASALFHSSKDDRGIRPDIAARVEASRGRETTRITPLMTETDAPFAHAVAGDVLSPGKTAAATEAMTDWIKGL